MRVTSKILALALFSAAALQSAFAGTVPLSFEDITLQEGNGLGMVKLLDRYKDDKHIQFTDSAWGVVSYQCRGWVGFNAYDGGCGALWLVGDPRDDVTEKDPVSFTLNFTDGFVAGSSFYYSALARSGVTIELFTGLNGTGIGTVLSGLTTSDCSIADVRFCDWTKLTLDFTGTAYSIVVKGPDESFMLDGLNLVQANTTPPTDLPEPGSIALALSALGALGWSRKRAAAR